MSTWADRLHKGQRVWINNRAGEIVGKEYIHQQYDRWDMGYYSSRYEFKIRWDSGETSICTNDKAPDLYDALTYDPESGLNIGDTVEIQRDGLEPNLRGRLLEVNDKAEIWPYRIGEEGGTSIWFGVREITKIHSVVSRERSPKATEALKKVIAEKREELEALETALEVLQYATT